MPDQIDPRNIQNGWEIPSEGYCDQPYVVVNDDGSWTCVMTTGRGREGQPGQHVVTFRSEDEGRTWSEKADLEPADGPEASYAVLLKAPSGRIFAFYNHNTDNVRKAKGFPPAFPDGWCRRVDSLGHFVFKYSDDGGRSWSDERYEIPQRKMEIDRENANGGELLLFWNVGRAFAHGGAAYVPLHKVDGFGHGFFTRSEGVLLRSDNLLTEPDPAKIRWETLPDGERGLRAPDGGGPIAEEQSFVVLSDGSFYSVYRTIDGSPGCAYSRDGGRTWSPPRYGTYADGRQVRHPRAATFAWRCSNGKYLYWFHNNGTTWYNNGEHAGNRNPVWLCGGVEADSPDGHVILWSQPEIALYADDPFTGMSYPDLVEDEGNIYLTETQKTIARVHQVDPSLLEALWTQHERDEVARDGLVLEWEATDSERRVAMPALPALTVARTFTTHNPRAGFAIEMSIELDTLSAGTSLFDGRTPEGKGPALVVSDRGTIELVLNDGWTECRWDTDPGAVRAGARHHLVAIVDGGPRVISFVVDGTLCDGGGVRPFGWGRFSTHLRGAGGSDTARIGQGVGQLRIYNRFLRTSEAIGNCRASRRTKATVAT
jgi:hypothetical protein